MNTLAYAYPTPRLTIHSNQAVASVRRFCSAPIIAQTKPLPGMPGQSLRPAPERTTDHASFSLRGKGSRPDFYYLRGGDSRPSHPLRQVKPQVEQLVVKRLTISEYWVLFGFGFWVCMDCLPVGKEFGDPLTSNR